MEDKSFNSNIKQISDKIWKDYFNDDNLKIEQYQPTLSILPINKNNIDKRIIILQYDNIPSTMIPSEHWPRETLTHSDIYCFIAKEQSSGVGQKSNTWASPQGNVYLTLLTRYPLEKLNLLPIKVNNSIVLSLKQYCRKGSEIKIKWVNDVFINYKKVSGSLIKSEILTSNPQFGVTQIGIGVNIEKAPSIQFTCLRECSQQPINIQKFKKDLIENLGQILFGLTPFQEELKFYQSNLLYLKQEVSIYNSILTQKLYEGLFVGINSQGNALLDISGEIKTIFDGRMRPALKTSSQSINIKEIIKEQL